VINKLIVIILKKGYIVNLCKKSSKSRIVLYSRNVNFGEAV
jgi:hypothetical protein